MGLTGHQHGRRRYDEHGRIRACYVDRSRGIAGGAAATTAATADEAHKQYEKQCQYAKSYALPNHRLSILSTLLCARSLSFRNCKFPRATIWDSQVLRQLLPLRYPIRCFLASDVLSGYFGERYKIDRHHHKKTPRTAAITRDTVWPVQ